MKITVLKYGGSSLASPARRNKVADSIAESVKKGYKTAVVLSAMGRYPDPYATDTLISKFHRPLLAENGREKDLILSLGEICSCLTMSALLREKGHEALVMTGVHAQIKTDGAYGEARVEAVVPSAVLKAFCSYDIILVTGFQGADGSGFVTTLGRGGSDTSASALGAALASEEVCIYTDVDGVMTADPRIYAEAEVIPLLDFQEMGEMANEGARVLHTRSVEICETHNIPLLVKNALSEQEGSRIGKAEKKETPVTGLIHKTAICEFIADLTGSGEDEECLFRHFAASKISLDLINLCYGKLFFAVTEKDAPQVEAFLTEKHIPYRTSGGRAKIACVGSGMRGQPGVMAKINEILFWEGIAIHRSVDSMMSIACLIDEENVASAVKALHTQLNLQPASQSAAGI